MIVQGQLRDEMISVALLPSLASLVGHRVLYSTADEGSLEVTSLNSTVIRELNTTTTANCNCGSILSVQQQLQKVILDRLAFESILRECKNFLGHLAFIAQSPI